MQAQFSELLEQAVALVETLFWAHFGESLPTDIELGNRSVPGVVRVSDFSADRTPFCCADACCHEKPSTGPFLLYPVSEGLFCNDNANHQRSGFWRIRALVAPSANPYSDREAAQTDPGGDTAGPKPDGATTDAKPYREAHTGCAIASRVRT